jgi:hypothetical protein
MFEFFERIFGGEAQPVRRTVQARLTVDENGDPVIKPIEGKSVTLSEDGSIDEAILETESFHHCGCSATLVPAGGHCAEPGCRQVSCRNCFQKSRCESCFKPLCLEHTHQLEDEDGKVIGRYCSRCFGPRHRKGRALAVARAILRPFHDDLRRIEK